MKPKGLKELKDVQLLKEKYFLLVFPIFFISLVEVKEEISVRVRFLTFRPLLFYYISMTLSI